MGKNSFILGSSSDCRASILHSLGFKNFSKASPDIDETSRRAELPHLYAKRMALEKMQKLIAQHPGEVILTADTVASCGRKILPKATSEQDVKECLEAISGRRHRLYTSVCVSDSLGKIRQKTVLTTLKIKRLTETEIKMYISSGEGIGKAGGYSIQGIAQSFVIWMSGSYFNVVGLPAYEAVSLLSSVGVKQDLQVAE